MKAIVFCQDSGGALSAQVHECVRSIHMVGYDYPPDVQVNMDDDKSETYRGYLVVKVELLP